MSYINNNIYRRIFSRPHENFIAEIGNVKYVYNALLLKKYIGYRINLSLFVTPKLVEEYWRKQIWRYCPCTKYGNLYRINPHAKSFLRIEPNYINFIMPFFYLYVGNYYFGRYEFLWYNYLIYEELPYDNYYIKSLLCVLM